MDRITIRPATMMDMERAVFVEGKATPNLHYLERVFKDWLDEDNSLLVAEIDEELVGVGKFSVMPDHSAWLETLRVLPDFQGRGIGKAFYNEFLKLASLNGIKRLGMYTTPDNSASKGLAEINGFKLKGAFLGYSMSIDDGFLKEGDSTFEKFNDSEAAYNLMSRDENVWNSYFIMNRTFLRSTRELISDWTKKGFIYYDAVSGSVIAMGSRFLPEQGIHIAYISGDIHRSLTFAATKAAEQRIPKLQCMFPEDNIRLSSALKDFGFQPDTYSCIVMECQL